METRYSYPKYWFWLTLVGFLLVLVGLAAIASPYFTTFAFILVLGWLLICGGIIQIVYAFSTIRTGGFLTHFLIGVFSVLIGAIFIYRPEESVASLTLLIAILFLTIGLFRIFASLFMRFEQWGWFLALGIIDVLLGALILAQWPLSALWLIGLFVGIDFLFTGWSFIATSLFVKQVQRDVRIEKY